MTTSTSPGVLLLLQQALNPIEEAAALAALPDAARAGRRETVVLDLTEANRRAIAARDWHDAGRQLAEQFVAHVRPRLDANPGFEVAYFGAVSIPLAVQLGFLCGTWSKKTAYLHHHINKDWLWPDPDAKAQRPEVLVSGLPNDKSLAEGDIVVRVSTSHFVDPAQARDVVSRPLAEVELRLEPLGEDGLTAPVDLEAVGTEWKRVLDTLHEKFPNARTIHLFASVQVAVAFMLGARINPRIHPALQTYQYEGRQEPKYYPALLIEDEIAARPSFTTEEKQLAIAERAMWQEELERVQTFAATLATNRSSTWLEDVLPEAPRRAFAGTWGALPRLVDLQDLLHSRIELAEAAAGVDGFLFVSESRTWVLADDFLIPLLRRITNKDERRRAARLFLLHEGLHAHQQLTVATSRAVGRFAKILEEIDYQADSWALLHERAYVISTDPSLANDGPTLARSLMSVAIETMLSFDAQPGPLTQMQVRRVARYLIWSWQYLETLRLQPADDPSPILATRPLIELAGAEIRVRDNRVWYLLDPRHLQNPEVAVYRSNRLHRFGDGPSLPIDELLDALRRCEAARFRNALRGVFDQVVPPTR